jgi:hypothetical protein
MGGPAHIPRLFAEGRLPGNLALCGSPRQLSFRPRRDARGNLGDDGVPNPAHQTLGINRRAVCAGAGQSPGCDKDVLPGVTQADCLPPNSNRPSFSDRGRSKWHFGAEFVLKTRTRSTRLIGFVDGDSSSGAKFCTAWKCWAQRKTSSRSTHGSRLPKSFWPTTNSIAGRLISFCGLGGRME